MAAPHARERTEGEGEDGAAAGTRKRVRFSEDAPHVFVFDAVKELHARPEADEGDGNEDEDEDEDGMETDEAARPSGKLHMSATLFADEDGDGDGEDSEDEDAGEAARTALEVEYSDSESDGDGDGDDDEHGGDETGHGAPLPHRLRPAALRRFARLAGGLWGAEAPADAALVDEPDSDHETADPVDWAALGDDGVLTREAMASKRADVRLPELNGATADGWLHRSLGQEDLSLAAVSASAEAGTLHGHDLPPQTGAFAHRARAIFAGLDELRPAAAPDVPAAPSLSFERRPLALPAPAPAKPGRAAGVKRAPTPVPGFVREPDKWTRYTLEDDAVPSAATERSAALDFLADLRSRRRSDGEGARELAPSAGEADAAVHAAVLQTAGQLRIQPAVEVGVPRRAAVPRAGREQAPGLVAAVPLVHLAVADDDMDAVPPDTETAAVPVVAGPVFRKAAHRPSRLRHVVAAEATDDAPASAP